MALGFRVHDVGVIVVLGSPNREDGTLSPIAVSRCELALLAYRRSPLPVLPTGGQGEHFNRSPRPHFEYLSAYLAQNGVPRKDILAGVPSANTVEDVTLVKAKASGLAVGRVWVVTSDFHARRVDLLFDRLAPELVVSVLRATTRATCEELQSLADHESAANALLEEMPGR